MGNLVGLICPTRGRPWNASRLFDAWEANGVCSDLIFCLDDGDPETDGYRELARRAAPRGLVYWMTGPRMGLCGWTDRAARDYQGLYQALMSIGDDHVPETHGFDRILLAAAQETGGGFAYGFDGITHQASSDFPEPHCLPSACLITTNITRALDRMCLPGARHMFTDPYWMLLAEAAGCRHYLPDVHVTHHHPAAGRAAWDRTYSEGGQSWPDDERAYWAWKQDQLAGDARRVREVLACS